MFTLLFLFCLKQANAANFEIMENGRFSLEGTAHNDENYEWQIKAKGSFDIVRFKKMYMSFKGAIQSISWGSDKGPGVGLRNVNYNLVPFFKWQISKNQTVNLFFNHWSIHLADLNAIERNADGKDFNLVGIGWRHNNKFFDKNYTISIEAGESSIINKMDYDYNNSLILEGEIDLVNMNIIDIFLKGMFELINTEKTYYRTIIGLKFKTNKKSSVKIFAGTQSGYIFSAKEGLITNGPFVGANFTF